jgi:segregation and condensation protein B
MNSTSSDEIPSKNPPDPGIASENSGSSESRAPDVIEKIGGYLEAMLFAAPNEVNPAQLASVLEVPVNEVERGLRELEELYKEDDSGRGLRLQSFRGRYQLTTAPQFAAYVERFLGLESTTRLSRAALETLAIVLYRQPVTRPQIEAIRGVNSDGVVRSLLLKDLIQEIGRAEAPGRPILYSATPECLQYFGLSSLSELPPLNLDEPPSTDAEY